MLNPVQTNSEGQIIDQVFFKVNKENRQVLSHDIILMQDEKNGKPYGTPQITLFQVKVKSNGKSTLLKWMEDSVKAYNGSIDFYSNGSLVYQITFSNAFCKAWNQTGVYSPNGGVSSLSEEITILPTTFKWGS